jgi:hypothetical protein
MKNTTRQTGQISRHACKNLTAQQSHRWCSQFVIALWPNSWASYGRLGEGDENWTIGDYKISFTFSKSRFTIYSRLHGLVKRRLAWLRPRLAKRCVTNSGLCSAYTCSAPVHRLPCSWSPLVSQAHDGHPSCPVPGLMTSVQDQRVFVLGSSEIL